MADSTTLPDVTRTTGDAALKAALRRDESPTGKAGRLVLWLAVILMGIAALMPVTRFARQEIETWVLLQAEEVTLAGSETVVPSADYFEGLSELSIDADVALMAARRAVAADPSRAFVWTRIAWLEATKAGKVSAPSLEALTRSMDACPLCNEDLIRWRFNFVLANWNAMPEALRARAFEHADLLSWSGQNAEFLAEMRIKSELAGIPYAAYRSAVKTPVKSWDLAPPADTAAVGQPAAPGG